MPMNNKHDMSVARDLVITVDGFMRALSPFAVIMGRFGLAMVSEKRAALAR